MMNEAYISKRFPIANQLNSLSIDELDQLETSIESKSLNDSVILFAATYSVLFIKLLLVLIRAEPYPGDQKLQGILEAIGTLENPKTFLEEENLNISGLGTIEVLLFLLWTDCPERKKILAAIGEQLVPTSQPQLSLGLLSHAHRIFLDQQNGQWIKAAEQFIMKQSIPDELWHQEFYFGIKITPFKLCLIGFTSNMDGLARIVRLAATTTKDFGNAWQSPYVSDNDTPLFSLLVGDFWRNSESLEAAKLARQYAPASAWQFGAKSRAPIELIYNKIYEIFPTLNKSHPLIQYINETNLWEIQDAQEETLIAKTLVLVFLEKLRHLPTYIEAAKNADPSTWATVVTSSYELGVRKDELLFDMALAELTKNPLMPALFKFIAEKTLNIPQIAILWKKGALLTVINALINNPTESNFLDIANSVSSCAGVEGWELSKDGQSAFKLLMQAVNNNVDNQPFLALALNATKICLKSASWIIKSDNGQVTLGSPIVEMMKVFSKHPLEPMIIQMVGNAAQHALKKPKAWAITLGSKKVVTLREIFLKALDSTHFDIFAPLFATHKISFNEIIQVNDSFLKKACDELLLQLQNPDLSTYADSKLIQFMLAPAKNESLWKAVKVALLKMLKDPVIATTAKLKAISVLEVAMNHSQERFALDSKHSLKTELPQLLEKADNELREALARLLPSPNSALASEPAVIASREHLEPGDLPIEMGVVKEGAVPMNVPAENQDAPSEQEVVEVDSAAAAPLPRVPSTEKPHTEVIALRKQLKTLSDENKRLLEMNTATQAQLRKSREQLSKAEGEVASSQQKYNSSQSTLNKKIGDLEKQVQALKQLEIELSRIQQEKHTAQNNLSHSTRKSTELQQKINDLQVQLNESTFNRKNMNKLESELRKEIKDLRSQLDAAKACDGELHRTLQSRDETIHELTAASRAKDRTIKEREATIEELQAALRSKNDTLSLLEQRSNEQQAQHQHLINDNASLTQRLSEIENVNVLIDTLRRTVWEKDYTDYSSLQDYTHSLIWGMPYQEVNNSSIISSTPWMWLMCSLIEMDSDFEQKKYLLDFILDRVPSLSQQAWAPCIEDGVIIDFPLHNLLDYIKRLANKNDSTTLLRQAVACLELTRHYSYSSEIWNAHSIDAYEDATAQELLKALLERKVLKEGAQGRLMVVSYLSNPHVMFSGTSQPTTPLEAQEAAAQPRNF